MTREQNEALYARRRPLYEAISDYRVVNECLDTAVEEILSAYDGHFGR